MISGTFPKRTIRRHVNISHTSGESRVRWLNLLIVICLLIAFSLVGLSLFVARGIYDCNEPECFRCFIARGIMAIAGNSAATAVAVFSTLTIFLITISRKGIIYSCGGNTLTLVSSKVRMDF